MGETSSSGTGAVAVAAATHRDGDVLVHFPGGDLRVRLQSGTRISHRTGRTTVLEPSTCIRVVGIGSPRAYLGSMEERLVGFRARSILAVSRIVLAVALVLQILWVTRDVLIWGLVALFLAMALSPAVEYVQAKGIGDVGLRSRSSSWARSS